MGLHWHGTAVDAGDPARLARWWAEVLHFRILEERPDVVAIAREAGSYPGMLFVKAGAARAGRNRLQLELATDDLAADIERLVDMGARHVAAAAAHTPWTVLADPEGNEFRLLPPA
ncbi:VOC family protein [Catellatospora sp. KI3]|uniref:VOC family protein n=1 Tax=Catellatospora sp. KI3 TaxID=3041620 RepID=UPI0024822FA5|nr:VOC family protein [Catellatospora sp. KI3]MDI1463920.1 VOC family protein [Catellatospora sp. KI3]